MKMSKSSTVIALALSGGAAAQNMSKAQYKSANDDIAAEGTAAGAAVGGVIGHEVTRPK